LQTFILISGSQTKGKFFSMSKLAKKIAPALFEKVEDGGR